MMRNKDEDEWRRVGDRIQETGKAKRSVRKVDLSVRVTHIEMKK